VSFGKIFNALYYVELVEFYIAKIPALSEQNGVDGRVARDMCTKLFQGYNFSIICYAPSRKPHFS
jgi:hypothetical protein